ncbi:MAG: hypothetical protein II951_02600 [Bacteroidales bacterium]|nr:hypothetical protein [Bacteroidales bacterium]
MDKIKLIPMVGFGNVRFGMTVQEVKKILGKPDEEVDNDRLGEDDEDTMITLYYDELGLSLSFDKLTDFRLSDIMTEGYSSVSMEGGIRFGMSVEDVRGLVAKADFGPMEESDLDEEEIGDNDEELTSYDLPEISVSLWFKEDRLDTIQLGPEYDENDNIVWPKK